MPTRAAMAFLIFLSLLIPLSAGRSSAEEFSAMMVNNTREGSLEGRVVAGTEMIRVESYEGTMIFRLDKRIGWQLFPDSKTYKVIPFKPLYVFSISKKVPGERSRVAVGKWKIGDVWYTKCQVTYELDGKVGMFLQWVSDDSDIPKRTSAGDGIWSIEYTNIRPNPQPDYLFEPPATYKEYTKPGKGGVPQKEGE